MKRILLFISLATLACSLTIGIFAACGAPYSVTNAGQAFATGLSGTPANVTARIWVYGVPASNQGTMNKTPLDAATCSEFDATHIAYETTGCGLPGYAFLTDWSYVPFAGCAGATARGVFVMEDTLGNFAIGSMTANGADMSQVDNIPTIAASNKPITGATVTGGGTGSDLTWAALGSNTGGCPGGDCVQLIDGVDIYYKVAASGGPPADLSLATGGWTLATGGSGLTWNSAGASVSGWGAAPPAGQAVWVMKVYSFVDGLSSLYGGTPTMAVGPTAAGVFGPMSASAQNLTINVNWTSNVETGVTGYQVYSSILSSGPFKAAGNPIAVAGNGHAYSSSFTMPATKPSGTVFVKVKATKSDGTEEWTPVKKVLYGIQAAPPSGPVK